MKSKITPLLIVLAVGWISLCAQSVQTPAEFERNEAVLLVWDYHPARDAAVADIAAAIQDVAKVWIIYYPGTAPADTNQIRAYLRSRGVLNYNVHFIPAWTETLWIRDFGPLPFYANVSGSALRFLDAGYAQYNRPKDDSIPSQIGRRWNIPVLQLPLQLEGGNLIFDGFMRGFGSKRLLDQNAPLSQSQLANLLKSYFGLEDFVFFDKLLNSGGGIWMHVDMYMKMLDHETIMVSQYPSHLPDYQLVENIAGTLGSIQSTFGRNYNIIRIPAPPKANGTYATSLNDEMRSYTNSLTINNVVVVPKYNIPMDLQAKQIYEQAMPGYIIKMVDASMLTPLYGAIHCITREIPTKHLLRIRHARIIGKQHFSSNFPVLFKVFGSNLIDSAFINYRLNNQADFQKIFVYPGCQGYLGFIPDLSPADTVHYYLEARSGNNTVKFPLVAPNATHSFWFHNVTASRSQNLCAPLRVVPNPIKNNFALFADDKPVLEGMVMIYDASGTKVASIILNGEAEINLSKAIPSGLYLLRLVSPNYVGNAKISIMKL